MWISSSSPAFRHCWIVCAPCTPTDFGLAAAFARATALGDRIFKIVDAASGAGVGSVGFWTKEWRDGQVYEVGWMVVPEFVDA